MTKHRIASIWLLVLLVGIGYFIYASEVSGNVFSRFPFRYGLDLNGGTELVYSADTSMVPPEDVEEKMMVLRNLIENRVNAFGVSEAIVQTEQSSIVAGAREHRLVVELPGVTDTEEAIAIIGKTPTLEFRLLPLTLEEYVQQYPNELPSEHSELFVSTGLTGSYLKRSVLEFQQQGGIGPTEPNIVVQFDEEGGEIFAKLTRENTGKLLGIFLDNNLISFPTIKQEITDGQGVITGRFTPEEARELANNLKFGALPMPISLSSTQVVGASLGAEAKDLGVKAGILGFALVALFLILWYRLPGVAATAALLMYVAISLAIFKLIPITLTAAGIAGFIISMGMAIDANVLIFERLKDELKSGKALSEAVKEGFHRAWLPVRDANLSGIITAIILFWLGNAAVKGFALTLGVGNVVSMFTAVTVVRTLLFGLVGSNEVEESPTKRFFFGGKRI